jgi:hypothetical protein
MRLLKLLLLCGFVTSACSGQPPSQPPAAPSNAILFEGARLIVGDGSPPVDNSAFLVENDRFIRVGRKGELELPAGAARVDLTGKTVMPALVDLHSHLGYTKVRDNSTSAQNFTRENLLDHLNRYAYYGIAVTLSMGVDRGELPFQLREQPPPGAALFRTAGRGIALPNAGPGQEFRKDAPYGVTTEAEARKAVQELAAKKVDIVKIWVDDRAGTVQKLPPVLYRAIIDESHKHNLRVAAHIFDLADAKELARSGIDGFAHGVRDKDIDEELLGLLKERPNIFFIPNLPESGTPVDVAWLGETLRRLDRAYRTGRHGDGRDDACPGSCGGDQHLGRHPRPRPAGVSGGGQERRLHRARRQSPGRHHQYTADRQGVLAGEGNRPPGVTDHLEPRHLELRVRDTDLACRLPTAVRFPDPR